MERMKESKIFHLGLCLAGSVSAGAYTAGVLDYLFETLQKWEERKKQNLPDTPSHDVKISVIGGASGGGMSGILAATTLQNDIEPVPFPKTLDEVLAERPGNKLYHSWVDMLGSDMFSLMLDTSDIQKNNILSLLNSDFIDKMADDLVRCEVNTIKVMPEYIYNPLKMFVTLTNLAGFPYEISYRGNTKLDKYYMAVHNDYACFQMKGDNKNDGWLNLDFFTGENVESAKQAAMATGAFPALLKSRIVRRKAKEVNAMKWMQFVDPVSGDEYVTQNVDGGLLNNEPFDKVRFVLNEITGQKDPVANNDPDQIESSILLVDPFPSEKPSEFKIDTHVLKTLGYTIDCLIGQGRAKPGDLAKSVNPYLAGQFLIAPSRRVPCEDGQEQQIQGEKAIASAALNGFGGFINKQFRVHDYFLGRYNCEIMLRDYFVIPESSVDKNPIFREGYTGVDKSRFCVIKKEKQIVNGKETEVEKKQYPIIPVFTERAGKFPIPIFSSGTNWPVISVKEVERFQPLIRRRAQAVLLNLLEVDWIKTVLLWIGAKVVLNKLVTKNIMEKILKELEEHKLIR